MTTADQDSDSRIATATAKVRDVAGQAKEAVGGAYGTAAEKVSDVVASAKSGATDAYGTVSEKAGNALGTAREKAGDVYATVSERTGDAYASVSEKAADAYAAAREKAAAAGKATAESVQENPAFAVIGAIVVGAVAAVLLPRSEREATLLAPIGAKIGEAVKLAAAAAKDAGIDALGEAGINRDAARSQIDKLLDTAIGAAKASATAAAGAVRSPE